MSEPPFEPIHEQIRDDLGPYAFGTLDATASARVAGHLPTCPQCTAALRDYHEIVRLLPATLSVSAPPPGARVRLLERARGDAQPLPPSTDRRRWLSRIALRSSASQLALAAALLLLLTGAGVALSAEFGSGQIPYSRSYDMWGEEHAPDAAGILVYQNGNVTLVVADMPILPPDRTYQLWFVTEEDDQVSAATFDVDEQGGATIPVEIPEEVESYRGCGVTEEPEGGSDWPTGDDVLIGPQWPRSG
jgi:anti-sigma-K factor RskA